MAINSSKNSSMHWVYYFGRGLARLILFSLSSWRVNGRENVPKQGPLLIVCNHLHVVDPPIIAVSVKLKAVLMAKEELFHHWFSRYFVQNFGSFPVRRRGADREALHQAEHWLQRGVSLIMFPEGKRSSTIQMQPALPGAALLSSRLGIPVLPVSIVGTEKLRERMWWLRRPRITVNIGKAFSPPSANGKLNRDELTQRTSYIMEHIAELLPPEYRGVYAKGDNAQNREGK
jgi:1-acyl-sn-glycerol-3-phosphate acyltransferase